MAHTFFCPTKLIFSDAAAADLGRELAALPGTAGHAVGAGPALLITDAGIIATGILARLMPALTAGGRPAEVFSDVPGNPGVATVAAALAAAQAVKPSALVAVGGGSAIDVAKAVSVLLAHAGVTWPDLQAGRAALTGARVPLIALPTTAGTGSEVSHVAVIGAADGFKKGIVHASLFPAAAIVDAGLALSLPPRLTAATGMDALVHAIEAYLGRRASPTLDLLALGAIRAIIRSLPLAVAGPSTVAEPVEALTAPSTGSGRGLTTVAEPAEVPTAPSTGSGRGLTTVAELVEALTAPSTGSGRGLTTVAELVEAPTAPSTGSGRVLAARRELAQAAAWAGMAMDQAGLGLCHALCGPLSAHHEVHHGLGNAVLLPAVLGFNAAADGLNRAEGRWPALRHALGLPSEAGPEALSGWATGFLTSIGLPTTLRDLGLDGATFPAIAAEATRMAMIGNNVRPAGEAECLAVLAAAL